MKWAIYYGDGTRYTSEQGAPIDAPSLNVQAIAHDADISIGRKITARHDFYWFDDAQQEWFGGDLFGLFDYLQRTGLVKFGRLIGRPAYETLIQRAVTDPFLQPKTAWDTHEPR